MRFPTRVNIIWGSVFHYQICTDIIACYQIPRHINLLQGRRCHAKQTHTHTRVLEFENTIDQFPVAVKTQRRRWSSLPLRVVLLFRVHKL